MKIQMTPVQPISKREAYCISPPMKMEVDVFPPETVAEGKKLRDYRVMELGITLGVAARVLEVTASEYSKLEHGELTADLDEVRRVLKDGKQLKDSGARTGRFQSR